MHHDVEKQTDELHRLFQHAKTLRSLHFDEKIDEEIVTAFVSYLCVRTSGYLETSIKVILRDYVSVATDHGQQPIARFVVRALDFTFNPSPGEIYRLLNRFSIDWKDSIRDSMGAEANDQLNGMVKNRNKIAHGEDHIIHLEDMESAFEQARRLLDLLHAKCTTGLTV